MARERSAQGVLFLQMKFCEPEGIEFPEVMTALKEASIPILTVDVELNMTQLGALRTRLEAFYELLEEI